jgi:hypothetical protein
MDRCPLTVWGEGIGTSEVPPEAHSAGPMGAAEYITPVVLECLGV